MQRRGGTGKPAKSLRRKTASPVRLRTPSVAQLQESLAQAQEQVATLTRELSEARQQQRASSEVLRAISRSPGELEPVFQAMLENAQRICDAKFITLYLHEGGRVRLVAEHNFPPTIAEAQRRGVNPAPDTALGGVIRTKQTVHIADLAATRSYAERHPMTVRIVEVGGVRTIVAVPLLKDNELVGIITIYPPRGPPLHRQADRTGAELRRASRHRHREHAAAQRAAPAHRRSQRGAGAADRDLRGAEGHLQLRRANWSRCSMRCWRTRRASARPSLACCSASTASAFRAVAMLDVPPAFRRSSRNASRYSRPAEQSA